MKTRLVTSLILALAGASSAAAQTSPAAPAQQAQPEATSPAPVEPAAPAAAATPPSPAPVPYQVPRGYVPPPQRYGVRPGTAPPPVLPVPRPYVRPHLPPPAPPPPRVYGNAAAPFSLGVGGVLGWRNEDHARFGNDKVNGGVNVFANYDVWAPSRAVVLSAGLDYRHDERSRTSLGDLKDNLLSADLTARMRAASWLWPHVRAGVGVAITQLEVRDRLAGITLEDRTSGVAGSFGAGFTLRTPTRALETYRGRLSSLSFGLLFEGGYTVAQDAKLSPEPSRGGDVQRASPASLSVERSAAYLRILAVTRF
ncbi:MAG: hypothetical protein ABW352_07590 [Polyangiales bacterium]